MLKAAPNLDPEIKKAESDLPTLIPPHPVRDLLLHPIGFLEAAPAGLLSWPGRTTIYFCPQLGLIKCTPPLVAHVRSSSQLPGPAWRGPLNPSTAQEENAGPILVHSMPIPEVGTKLFISAI